MPVNLSIKKVPDDIVARLKERALRHHRSVRGELLAIIEEAVRTPHRPTPKRAAMNHLTNARVVDDTAALLAYFDAHDKVKAGPVGCVGHCMSGQHITTVAAHFPHRMAAAASLYGVGIITDKEDSPHLLLDKIKGELYYAFAETDQSVPAHIPGELKQALDKADAKHELKVFPGTHHGFCFPERAVYDTLAAEETWTKIFAMWDRWLK
jgi:carboxymethylenebutenolidase